MMSSSPSVVTVAEQECISASIMAAEAADCEREARQQLFRLTTAQERRRGTRVVSTPPSAGGSSSTALTVGRS
jgi:hypothetical protein